MKRENIGECEGFFAETIQLIDSLKKSKVVTPVMVISLYLGSIAKSLAVIADKMCEEDEHA